MRRMDVLRLKENLESQLNRVTAERDQLLEDYARIERELGTFDVTRGGTRNPPGTVIRKIKGEPPPVQAPAPRIAGPATPAKGRCQLPCCNPGLDGGAKARALAAEVGNNIASYGAAQRALAVEPITKEAFDALTQGDKNA